jgi:hypothetical protein
MLSEKAPGKTGQHHRACVSGLLVLRPLRSVLQGRFRGYGTLRSLLGPVQPSPRPPLQRKGQTKPGRPPSAFSKAPYPRPSAHQRLSNGPPGAPYQQRISGISTQHPSPVMPRRPSSTPVSAWVRRGGPTGPPPDGSPGGTGGRRGGRGMGPSVGGISTSPQRLRCVSAPAGLHGPTLAGTVGEASPTALHNLDIIEQEGP